MHLLYRHKLVAGGCEEITRVMGHPRLQVERRHHPVERPLQLHIHAGNFGEAALVGADQVLAMGDHVGRRYACNHTGKLVLY